MADCQNFKNEWEMVKAGYSSSTFFITNPWARYFLKYLDCDVHFDCKQCCKDPNKGGGCTPKYGCDKTSCDISICVKNVVDSGKDMQGVFAHELTHCNQYCTGIGPRDCKSCFCSEIQAYRRTNPALTDVDLINKASDSCTGSEPPFCTMSEAVDKRAYYLGHADITRACALYGKPRVLP
jgi:hypothetical protein